MQQKIIEKTKSVEQIFYENNLLANSILDLRSAIQKAMGSSADVYNLKGSCAFSMDCIGKGQEYDLKKAITTFENIKGDLKLKGFKGMSSESLLGAVEVGDDKIRGYLMKNAGL